MFLKVFTILIFKNQQLTRNTSSSQDSIAKTSWSLSTGFAEASAGHYNHQEQ